LKRDVVSTTAVITEDRGNSERAHRSLSARWAESDRQGFGNKGGQPEETRQSGSIVFFKLFPERSAIDSEDSGRCGFVAVNIGHNIPNILGLNRFQGSVGLPDHKG